MLIASWKRLRPCDCVYRGAFRVCWQRYQRLQVLPRYASRVSQQWVPRGKDTKLHFERRTEDYLADFWLLSRRHLDEREWKLFRLHFIEGREWKPCCAVLGMDRGNFFHAVYRIEQRLGRVFVETRPYGLYPLEDYFSSTKK